MAIQFANAHAVVLVRVSESTYPPNSDSLDYYSRSLRATARIQVLRSWKGPFSAGQFIAVATRQECLGFCVPYAFQRGEEVLVFVEDTAQPLSVTTFDVVAGPHVRDAMPELEALSAGSPARRP